ncbi:protein of unknown function [Pseudomonas sp. JV551A1]|uniref:Uncharacterized protein n=1 Tax=Pseudomonas inefficax TaxID=2078786 RepID=A0AAQ1PB93_9PSED|nr:protein of unknown function [Pseudomonas sp. JV551A1]SPO62663.1 protein of unknown function [Pseudomonas inefficax]
MQAKGNALFGLPRHVVISSLTVYTRNPTARGLQARTAGGRRSLGGGYLTSTLTNNFALIR